MKDHASPGRRAAAYWFADGLEDILFGLTLLIVGASALLWRLYASHRWVKLTWLVVLVEILLYFSARRRIVDFLKSRITYPRTGYVQPPEEIESAVQPLTTLSLQPGAPPKQNVTSFKLKTVNVFLFFLVFLAMPSLNRASDEMSRWFVPVLMAALAAALYALNRNSEHPYQWRSTLVLALMGLVFLWVDVSPLLQPLLPLLLGGAWLAAVGGGKLIHYLRENPYPPVGEGA